MKTFLYFNDWVSEKFQKSDFYKNQLNSTFWRNGIFDPAIRDKLLRIAYDFYGSLKLTAQIKDIQLTGSLANYTWNNKSDLDVHILIDFSDIDDNKELVKKALDGTRFIWNLRHKIILRKHEVELYVQDINEPHNSSGLFSLLNNKWVREPKYNKPEIDIKDVEKKFDGIIKEIDHMGSIVGQSDFSSISATEIYNYANQLKKKIMEMRKEGLAREGEFSVENLVFKKLRGKGYIEKIIELVSKAYKNIYNE